jgi:predicted ABC-type sugar transport system permease subunit
MKKLLCFLLFTSTASAATAFLVGEETTGMTKQCYYEFAGNRYTRTVQSFQLCPLSIQV